MLPQSDRYLTVSDAAKLVGVTTQAVRVRVGAGKLAAQRVFDKMVVERAGVEAWIAERAERHLTLNAGGV